MSRIMIQIELNKLYPHPNNPRKDVGDVTELADSIRTNGVYQNLTVIEGGPGVPEGEQGYTVIIGHRRLAASKQAGLDTLPCMVVKMDAKEQVSTMLLENMQRSDLTVYEQAQGFQMMFDLGETEKGIAEKTGFSRSTISKRLKLLNLDKEKFKETQSRDIRLEDYLKVAELNDPEARNRVLDSIGTSDFNIALATEKYQEKKQKSIELNIAAAREFATEITVEEGENTSKYIREKYCYIENSTPDNLSVQKPDGEGPFYFYTQLYSWTSNLIIVRERTEADKMAYQKTPEEIAKEKRGEELKEWARNTNEAMYNRRIEFIKNYTGSKEDIGSILSFAVDYELYKNNYCNFCNDDFSVASGCEIEETPSDGDADYYIPEMVKFEKLTETAPQKILLAYVYSRFGENEKTGFIQNWSGEYLKNKPLEMFYDLLEELGFVIIDEDRLVMDGTHPMFDSDELDIDDDSDDTDFAEEE